MQNKHRTKILSALLFSPDSLQVAQDLWNIGKQLGHYILGQDGKIQPNPSLLAVAEGRKKDNKCVFQDTLHNAITFFFFGHIVWSVGLLVPQPGIEPGPLAVKNSQNYSF